MIESRGNLDPTGVPTIDWEWTGQREQYFVALVVFIVFNDDVKTVRARAEYVVAEVETESFDFDRYSKDGREETRPYRCKRAGELVTR